MTAKCTKMKNAKHAKLLFSMKKKWLVLAFLQRQSFVHVSLIKMGQLPPKYITLSGFSVTLIDLKYAEA